MKKLIALLLVPSPLNGDASVAALKAADEQVLVFFRPF